MEKYMLALLIAVYAGGLCYRYLSKNKRRIDSFQITIMGGPSVGKTATLALLFRVICEHFAIDLSATERKDLLNLLKHGTARVQGRLPARLEIDRENGPLQIEFCDSPCFSDHGYLRYQDHSYIADTNLLVFCVDLDGDSQKQNKAFDEMTTLVQLVERKRKHKGKVPFLAIATRMAKENLPDWQQAHQYVKNELYKTQPNIMRKCCLFPGHRFWFTVYDAGEIWGNEVSCLFREQWPQLIDWIEQNTLLETSLAGGIYQKLYRVFGEEHILILLSHRWNRRGGENFAMHLPSGKANRLFHLDNGRRYWSTSPRLSGECRVYDAMENKYLHGRCVGHGQSYVVLENATVIHQGRKLCGERISWDENVFCSGRLYLDISTDTILERKGFRARFLSYPGGESIDLATGKLGVFYRGRFRYVGSLIDSLVHPKKKYAARQALTAMGSAAALYMVLSLEKAGERADAVKLELKNIAPPPLRVVKQLMPFLKHHSAPVRYAVASVLMKIDCKQAAQALLPLLEEPGSFVKRTVVKILAKREIAAVGPLLIKLLDSSDRYVCQTAIAAMGTLKCRAAVPALLSLLTSQEINLRMESISALGKIGDRQAMEYLIPLLCDENPKMRNAAATALAQITPEQAKEYFDAVVKIVK